MSALEERPRVGLALIATWRNVAEQAATQYAAFRSHKGTCLIPVSVAGDRLLGLLAAGSGRPEAAKKHFEAALTFCDRNGYRSEYAWSVLDYADVLIEHGEPRDHEKALALYEQARMLASHMRMRPIRDRVASGAP